MVSICFYFQVHQPFRLRKYTVFDIGQKHDYFDDERNSKEMQKIAHKCYIPANNTILALLRENPKFKVAYSISGTAIEQMKLWAPEALETFKSLAKTGQVEFLSETYYHSLAAVYSKEEFRAQIEKHRELIQTEFGQTPKVFRNTELIFNNEIAHEIERMGYKAIIAEGADHVLGWRSPNFVYTPKTTTHLKLLLKNYKLSDDIAFRFSERSWKEWPLTAPKFANWVAQVNGNGNLVNLFMDYETFGEHQWESTGIFEFLKALPNEILKHPHNDFVTPSEAAQRYESVGELDIHHLMSWADVERDLSAWLGNKMQHSSIAQLYSLSKEVHATKNEKIICDWRKLQTSDHFYYMCTKWFSDGDVHKYFSPYESPYEAFIWYMNVLNDLKIRIKKHQSKTEHELTIETAARVKQ